MRVLWVYLIVVFALIEGVFAVQTEFDFYGLRIGQNETEVENIITSNTPFRIDESRYLGKINEAVPFIIKATYFPYIRELYIQFYSNISYGIVIRFNPAYFDYFSLTEKLEDKYGTPKQKTSKVVLWDSLSNTKAGNKDIRLQLEYPSTVKVIDFGVMQKMHAEVSQKMVTMTNTTIIETIKRELLGEL